MFNLVSQLIVQTLFELQYKDTKIYLLIKIYFYIFLFGNNKKNNYFCTQLIGLIRKF